MEVRGSRKVGGPFTVPSVASHIDLQPGALIVTYSLATLDGAVSMNKHLPCFIMWAKLLHLFQMAFLPSTIFPPPSDPDVFHCNLDLCSL